MQVKQHPFFRDINWDTLARQKVKIFLWFYCYCFIYCFRTAFHIDSHTFSQFGNHGSKFSRLTTILWAISYFVTFEPLKGND